MATTAAQHILTLAKRHGVVRSRDVEAAGIAREQLLRLYRKGVLERIARGTYVLAEAPVTEYHGLAVAAKQVPKSTVCLLSALRFHGLTTQDPHEVWIAIHVKSRRPKATWPPLRIVRFSGQALSEGVEEHVIEGVPVRVYGVAKTLADCFKYRNKIGVDVAIEALRDAISERRAAVDEIHHFARVCRVERVIRPYLEALA